MRPERITTDKVIEITPAQEDRDHRGRFVPGHTYKSGGRPRRATELTFLKKLRDVVTEEAWQQIVHSAISAAIDGDAKARDWLSNYLLGPPTGSRLVELAVAELTWITTVTDRLVEMELQNTRSPMHQLVLARISEKIGFDKEDNKEEE